MNNDDALVERIVQNVMQRIRATAEPQPSAGATQRVVIQESVITGELLEAKLNGAQCIEITATAVLTPSARDWLRNGNIECLRRSETKSTGKTNWKAIVVLETPAIKSALNDLEQSTGLFCNREIAGTTREAVSAAVSAICRAEADGAVIFTGEPQASACRANRNPRVRAAVIEDVRKTESIRKQMGANLFCIDPAGRSYIELRNLLRAVIAGGPPRQPEHWNENT